MRDCQLHLLRTMRLKKYPKKVNFILKDSDKKRHSWEKSILNCNNSNWDLEGASSLILTRFSREKLKKNYFRKKLRAIKRNRRLTTTIKRDFLSLSTKMKVMSEKL